MITNFEKQRVDHYDKLSMAYGLTIQNHRFTFLHNYPTYKALDCQLTNPRTSGGDCGKQKLTGLGSSLDFMKKDLDYACGSGMMVSLIFHDYADSFCREGVRDNECNAFLEKVSGSCVLAVFVGHLHTRVGLHDNTVLRNIKNKWSNDIPVLWTGSPEIQKWLRVKYFDTGLAAQVMHGTTEEGDALT